MPTTYILSISDAIASVDKLEKTTEKKLTDKILTTEQLELEKPVYAYTTPYGLTYEEWCWERARRIRSLLLSRRNRHFATWELRLRVWREAFMQKEYYGMERLISPFIKNLTTTLLSHLQKDGYIKTEKKEIYKVLKTPTLNYLYQLITWSDPP